MFQQNSSTGISKWNRNKVNQNISHIRLLYIPWSQSQLKPDGWLLQRMRPPRLERRLLDPSKPSTQNPHCGHQTCRSSGDPQPDHINPPPTCHRNIVNMTLQWLVVNLWTNHYKKILSLKLYRSIPYQTLNFTVCTYWYSVLSKWLKYHKIRNR